MQFANAHQPPGQGREQALLALALIDEPGIAGSEVAQVGFAQGQPAPRFGAAFGGLFAPAGTPAPVVATVNRAFNQAMRQPEVRETFEVKLQTALVGGTPEAFASFELLS